ncbi:MAG: succinate dehydrogenase, cytochrome b556 subunit [Legionellaceae bacterium]|nr:succinate dehydrogenase, cytochrome b556 subunit [Legionellaceae bacterium]
MNQQRPVNLDLGSIKFPPMAIASILHRISGLTLFLLLPVMLYLLRESLVSPESFEHTKTLMMTCAWYKLLMWAFSSAWLYHLLAGLRHLLMDMGIGETTDAGRRSALIVIVVSILGIMMMGACLWSVM